MIITDRFVVLNYPKTGSTFVRSVLRQLHGELRTVRVEGWFASAALALPRRQTVELMLPNTKVADSRHFDQHGTFSQIPRRFRRREVVSVVRNPFDRLLSAYRFRWWEKYPGVPMGEVIERFPGFPDLSFEDFLLLGDLEIRHRAPMISPRVDVGGQTVQFIQMFFRDPGRVLERLDDSFLDSDEYRRYLPPIRFLRTERLNDDVYEFLAARGYAPDRLDFIRKHPPQNTTAKLSNDEWTPQSVDDVSRRERLLFRILSDLGFEYELPQADQTPSEVTRVDPGDEVRRLS